MTLLNLTDIQEDADATPELFNSRFDAIANVINGHIDSSNLADGAVTTSKIADGAVTLSKLDTVTAGNATGGWLPLSAAPGTVTANGNHSYSVLFNNTDLTSSLTKGMRLKFTRSVAAPTQCTSLNGTTQYYSKTSPSGMTFTDDFVVSAWVKLTSYNGAINQIASRYNNTSGWQFRISTSGQVEMYGFNASGSNFSGVSSYQSIPLNKWVHVTAQLDMSAFTATTTTSYIMIDGVDVPVTVARAGTNPTALIQAGNLEIGGTNGGTLPFNGKIAQVAIYSAKVTQATILASMNQTLSGSETSLVSAYSFNNSINDLNANANNLTANGTAVATNADSPFSNDTAGQLNYGIVQAITYSPPNTTVVVQTPEQGSLPTSGTISSVSYSGQKVPYGFPSQKIKWSVESWSYSARSVAIGSVSHWTSSLLTVSVPIGAWKIGYIQNSDFISTVSGSRNGSWVLGDSTYLSAGTGGNTIHPLVTHQFTAGSTDGIGSTSSNTDIEIPTSSVFTLYGQIYSATGSESFTVSPNNNPTRLFAENAYL